jgi:NADH dehydrogenase
MEDGTHTLLAAAQEAGVRRFVLMSALGVDDESQDLTPYYGAKWEMERAVRAAPLEHVILRPSFVFGRDGGVLPTFIRQVRWSPVTTVVGNGRRRLQPIWVEDLAAYAEAAVDLPAAANTTFELGGPDQVTWNELYDRIKHVLGIRRPSVNVPLSLVRLGAVVVERLPRPPLTRDQLTMLAATDSVCDMTQALDVFGLPLTPLDEQIRRAA